VLQCVAVCCSVLGVCCIVLKCVAVCCSDLQCVAAFSLQIWPDSLTLCFFFGVKCVVVLAVCSVAVCRSVVLCVAV